MGNLWRSLLMVSLLLSCTTLPNDEREWQKEVDSANYRACVEAYRLFGGGSSLMVHRGHEHHDYSRVYAVELRGDLIDNNCRKILGPLWAEY